MSTARNAAMVQLQEQIQEIELLKATNGTYPSTPEGQLQQEQDIARANLALLKGDEAFEDSFYGKASKKVVGFGQGVKKGAFRANRSLANIPTPGGVWAALAVLLFLFLVLFPVNGNTRLYWLWLALTGNASIPQFVNPNGSENSGPVNPDKRGSNPQNSSQGGDGGGIKPLISSPPIQAQEPIVNPTPTITVPKLVDLTSNFTDLYFNASNENLALF